MRSPSLSFLVRQILLESSSTSPSWIPPLASDKRYILSPGPIESVKRVPNSDQKIDVKPIGLWYSVGKDWLNFSHDSLPFKYTHLYEVTIEPSRVLQVRTVEQTYQLYRQYGATRKGSEKPRPPHMMDSKYDVLFKDEEGRINWARVAERHAGVEFAPYHNELRLRQDLGMWYHTLDVESGCVWDPSGVKELKLLATKDSTPEVEDHDQLSSDAMPHESHAEEFGSEGHFGEKAAGALITTGEKVLLVLRSDEVTEPGTWGIPGGAMEHDEYPIDTAERETYEETGIDLSRTVKHEMLSHVWQSPWENAFSYTTCVIRVNESVTLSRIKLNWENSDAKWVDREWIRKNVGLLHPGLRQSLNQLLPVAFGPLVAVLPKATKNRQEMTDKAKTIAEGDFQVYKDEVRDIKKMWAKEVSDTGGSFDKVIVVAWGHCDDIEKLLRSPNTSRELSACPYPSWPVVPLELNRFKDMDGTTARLRKKSCRLGVQLSGKITFCANANLDSNTSSMFGVDPRRKYFGQESSGLGLQTWHQTIVTDKSHLRPNADFLWRSVRSPEEHDKITRSASHFGNWPEALIANWRPIALIVVDEDELSAEELREIAGNLPIKNTEGDILDSI